MEAPLLKKLQIENRLLKEDLNNLIPPVFGEGEDITLNGTAEARFKKLIIKGNTIQNGEPTPNNLVEIRNCKESVSLKISNENLYQIASFPLESQELCNKDYLYDDGFHLKNRIVILDGTENWKFNGNNTIVILDLLPEDYGALSGDKIKALVISNYYISEKHSDMYFEKVDYGISLGTENIGKGICIHNKNFTTINEYKKHFADLYEQGKPVIVQYELLNEKIIPYTEEQRKAYNKLKNLKSYKDVTHIYSDDEISPIFEVEAFKNIEE